MIYIPIPNSQAPFRDYQKFMTDLQHLIERAESLLGRIENYFPHQPSPPDWQNVSAFCWRKHNNQRGEFQAVHYPHQIRLQDIQKVDEQKQQVERNTQQFLQKKPANHVLLWGARGTGKSSLIKGLLHKYADEGLRLVEVEKQDLIDLPDIVESLYYRSERFIVFCDDLSYEKNEVGYKTLKSVLDGSVNTAPDNILIYATSNRRHLLPEYMHENLEEQTVYAEIHPGEAVDEKISLSERFGLWISFHPFNQDEYLDIVSYWLQQLGVTNTEAEHIQRAALQWALKRASRSGRAAKQFAQDWAGRNMIK
jgi:predicted AAA+ superfamily ATPase